MFACLLAGLFYLSGARAFDIQVQALGGGAITEWTYLINEDNSADPWDPDPLKHPAQNHMASYSPIVAAGDQSNATGLSLPDGRYLISVRAAGHKLWGKHIRLSGGQLIEVPPFGGTPVVLSATAVIELVPDPHPLTKIVVQVFEDNHPTNSAPDPLEQRLQGFQVSIHDTVGDVTVDWYGNPLCSKYQKNPDGSFVLDGSGAPILEAPNVGGICLTDANGEVVIENIAYGKYEIEVIPPTGSDWVGTSTLEGTRFLPAWLEEGSDGTRFGRQAGLDFLGPEVYWYGFVRIQTSFPNPGGGTITGRVVNLLGFPPTQQFVLDTNEPMPYPHVAVNNIGGNDEMVYAGRGNADGSFSIPNVPAGLYQLAIWDEPREWIIGYYTVQVANGQTVHLGDIGMRRWFGWVSGNVFLDPNENALKDPGELGLNAIDLYLRFRDGSIHHSTFTDANGFYEFPTARSPLLKMEVAEVGFGRLGVTGHSRWDPYNPNKGIEVFPGDLGGELLAAQLTAESRRSVIDWGKRNYDLNAGENGGIAGAVIFATTRNEFDARLAAAEDYEPGIPNVTIKLFEAVTAPPYAFCDPEVPASCMKGTQLNEIQSDAWSHPTAADVPSRACDALDQFGNPVGGAGPLVAEQCIEVPMVGNETQDGAWDGGWAIDMVCAGGWSQGCAETPMPPGDYIVEAITPPFYQILKEEDQNTDEGSDLVPLVPPPPCVGPMHLVTDPRNPFNGQMKPLCNERLVTVQAGQNAAAEFYFYTDADNDGDATTRTWETSRAVPVPGRIFGVVENDLFVDTDPNSITYAEPRPVAHVPVGIRDYTGRLLTVVYTDEYGRYEVMLPSTFQANCPTPGGVCPGMYIINPNDPGDPQNPLPGFDATYKLTTTTWDVWPGKMTAADTPIDPLQGADGGSGSCDALPGDDLANQPDVPPIDPETFPPQIYLVTNPIGAVGDQITITGPRFRQPGTAGDQGDGFVTLGGVQQNVVSWSNEDITFTIGGVAPGAHQLLVTTHEGQTTVPGITIHVTGAGYNPAISYVDPPANVDTPAIQNAISAAPAGGLVVIRPGHYRENVIVSKGVSLQGYGPGGHRNVEAPPTGGGRVFIQGSVIDGKWIFTSQVRQDAWDAVLGAASFNDNGQVVPKGASITVLADDDPNDAPVRIDGLTIGWGAGEGGGGVHMHAFCDGCQVSNNLLDENQGLLAGGVSLGQPTRTVPPTLVNNHNDNIRIHRNRVIGNGATLYGGGAGIFGGAENYVINDNRICGNFSAQYGGGIAHWGRSNGGQIIDNEIVFNESFDEGGGVLVGGEPVENGNTGSGAVDILRNIFIANLSNDDGGGIRLLHPWHDQVRIVNNILNNNTAADMGGGIALGDASNVQIVNNSIAGNHSTATAEDRDLSCFTGGLPPYPGAGCPHGAGLISEGNSTAFQATLPGNAPVFSNPVMFNNIFWDNDAMTFNPDTGLVVQRVIDLEVFGTATPQYFNPTFSVLTVNYNPGGDHPSNYIGAPGPVVEAPEVPLFVSPEVGEILGYGLRAVASLVDGSITVMQERPPSQPGDFHLIPGSVALDNGTPTMSGVNAPTNDFEGDPRPMGGGYDRGADEMRIVDTTGPFFEPGGAEPLVTPNPTNGAVVVTLTATASDVAYGNSNVVRVEWFEGGDPGLGQANLMTPVDGFYDSPTEAVTASIDVSGWSLGQHVINVRAQDVWGNWGLLDNVILNVTLPGVTLYFSTEGNTAVGALANPDDADIYSFDGITFGRIFDATAAGLPGNADIDALKVVDDTHFYVSFTGNVTLPGGVAVASQDIAYYSAGTWSLYFDGSDVGLSAGGEDMDGFEILPDNSVLISTSGSVSVPGLAGNWQDEDLLRCVGSFGPATSCTWSVYFDGSDIALTGANEDVDAAAVNGTHLYLSTRGAYTVTGNFTGSGGDDIFICRDVVTGANTSCVSFGLLFDGSANGIVDNVDAFDF